MVRFHFFGGTEEFKGIDGLRAGFLDWLAPWASYYDEIEDVVTVGDDRIVVIGRERGYRLDMEAEVQGDAAGIYTVRDGKIARAEYYVTREEALKAAGLSE